MLTRADRWMLAGAWLLIATAGAAGAWKISRIPALDPATARTLAKVQRRMRDAAVEPPPPLKRMPNWAYVSGDVPEAPLYGATLLPRIVARVEPLPPVDVDVQPLAAVPQAKASLDGVALTWRLEAAPVHLEPRERAKKAVPATGLRIERSTDGLAWKEVARSAPKAGNWLDATAAPRTSYAYRVILEKPDQVRTAKQGDSVAEARTPSDRRARLVGGDAKVAILRVEAYNRGSRAWEGRERTARPGDELWPGGWRLSGLRFKGSVLVAEAVVEDGRPLELTTRD